MQLYNCGAGCLKVQRFYLQLPPQFIKLPSSVAFAQVVDHMEWNQTTFTWDVSIDRWGAYADTTVASATLVKAMERWLGSGGSDWSSRVEAAIRAGDHEGAIIRVGEFCWHAGLSVLVEVKHAGDTAAPWIVQPLVEVKQAEWLHASKRGASMWKSALGGQPVQADLSQLQWPIDLAMETETGNLVCFNVVWLPPGSSPGE